jgi:signal transduction histidine kinase
MGEVGLDNDNSLDNLLAQASVAFWNLDLHTKTLSANAYLYSLLGFPNGLPLNWDIFLTSFQKDHQLILNEIVEKINQKLMPPPSCDLEIIIQHPPRLMICHFQVKKNQEGDVESLQGLINPKNDFLLPSIDHLPGAIFELVLNDQKALSFSYISQKMMELYEITHEDLSQYPLLPITMIFHSDSSDFHERLLRSTQTLEEVHWVGRIITKEGKKKWLQIKTSVQQLANGEIHWPGHVFDVGQEQELLLKNHMFSLGEDIGVWEWDLENQQVNYDRTWCFMLGEIKEHLLPNIQEWKSRLHPDDVDETLRLLDDFLEGKKDRFEVRYRMRHQNHSWVPILSRGHITEKDERGRAKTFYGIHHNFTSYQDIEVKLLEQERIIQDRNKMVQIGELAAGMAHEINNPLAIILGFNETIQKLVHEDQIQHYLEKQRRAAYRIQNIVNSLRFFVRVEEEEKDYFESVEAIEKTIDLVRDIYRKDQVEIIFHVNTDHNVAWVQGNQGKFQQVVLNLLSNAHDALIEKKGDQQHKKITVEFEDHETHFEWHVKDNGTGIPERLKEKIFHTFFTTKEVNKGTGLGLSLCLSFVKQMGGDIEVFSEIDKGSDFVVTLKKSLPEERLHLLAHNKEEESREDIRHEMNIFFNHKSDPNIEEQIQIPLNLKKYSTFIVKTERLDSELLERHLKMRGHTVFTQMITKCLWKELCEKPWHSFFVPEMIFNEEYQDFFKQLLQKDQRNHPYLYAIVPPNKHLSDYPISKEHRMLFKGLLSFPFETKEFQTLFL